jgi:hypothetical protein
MKDALVGTPEQVAGWLLARYLPLRDSRAHSEPEKQQRRFLKGTAYLLMVGGLSLEVLLVATGQVSVAAVLFGLAVAALGGKFLHAANRPLQFSAAEPLENMVAYSQGIGLCRKLSEAFSDMQIQLDPLSCAVAGSCDGYDWETVVDREGLKPVDGGKDGYESYTVLAEAAGSKPAASRLWRRSSPTVNCHRIFWTVSLPGEFTPRAGQPSEHTSLERRESSLGKTSCVFTLPINSPDQPGLGHDGRTDYISSPLGLHHPEFVGEQVALSLIWMFNPRTLSK